MISSPMFRHTRLPLHCCKVDGCGYSSRSYLTTQIDRHFTIAHRELWREKEDLVESCIDLNRTELARGEEECFGGRGW